MKTQYKRILAAAALISSSASLAQAQVITAWNFENDTVAVNNNPAPSTGVGTASSIGMDQFPTPNIGVTTDDVLVGKSSDTGANTVADTTQTWRIRAQAGTAGAANGWSSAAPIGSQGAVFAASTAGFQNITVSFDWYATTQGEANLQLAYTTDGIHFQNVQLTLAGSDAGLQVLNNSTSSTLVNGSYVSDNVKNNSQGGQDWFTGLTATITDPAAANNPNFGFEIVNAGTGTNDISTQGTALNNNSGNWRFDNVDISGTSSVATVPDQTSTLVLGLTGFGALAALRRFKFRPS